MKKIIKIISIVLVVSLALYNLKIAIDNSTINDKGYQKIETNTFVSSIEQNNECNYNLYTLLNDNSTDFALKEFKTIYEKEYTTCKFNIIYMNELENQKYMNYTFSEGQQLDSLPILIKFENGNIMNFKEFEVQKGE